MWVQSPMKDSKMLIPCKFHTAVFRRSQAIIQENALLRFDFKQKV